MTSIRGELEVLKRDGRGRVRISAEWLQALLNEFEKSGAGGVKFARLVGIRYSTFANWVKPRRERPATTNLNPAMGPAKSAKEEALAAVDGGVRKFVFLEFGFWVC